MPDLVDEVDEEIRQERAALLARRFGGVFAALAMFVLAAVGGWQGWQWYENRNAAAAAEAFLAATRDAAAEVQARLAPLAAAGPWRASAREIVALAALAAGNTAEARRGLTELARDDGVPQGVRDRAQRLLSGIDG